MLLKWKLGEPNELNGLPTVGRFVWSLCFGACIVCSFVHSSIFVDVTIFGHHTLDRALEVTFDYELS